jgi:hypothetical protein
MLPMDRSYEKVCKIFFVIILIEFTIRNKILKLHKIILVIQIQLFTRIQNQSEKIAVKMAIFDTDGVNWIHLLHF